MKNRFRVKGAVTTIWVKLAAMRKSLPRLGDKPSSALDWPGRGYHENGWELVATQRGGMEWRDTRDTRLPRALDEIQRLKSELAEPQEDTARLDFLISWLNRESQYGNCINRWHPTKRTTLQWGSEAEWRGLLDIARKESR